MSVFDYEYKRSPDGIPDGFKYYGVGDATYIFGDDIRCHDFFRIVNSELKAYGKLYVNDLTEFLPICYFKSEKSGGEFLSIDYMFFVQCVARYLTKISGRESADLFVKDFKVSSENPQQKVNGLVLIYYYFQRQMNLVYVNRPHPKLQVSLLNYYTPTVYKNAKTSVEFGAVNFKVEELSNFLKDANLMKELLGGAKYMNAVQVAYGKTECDKYWEKLKATRKYFLTSENFSY